jgi:subtilisin family serine protease
VDFSGRRRWLLVAGAATVVLLGGGAGIVIGNRLDGGSGSDGPGEIEAADVLSEEQLELIHQAVPDSSCASEPTPPPDGDSLVALDVLRVEGTCLDDATEYVPADQVAERRAELDRDPSVVAAAVIPVASPDQVDDRRDDQWALDALGAPQGSTELPWPNGDSAVVAVVDTGVNPASADLTGAVIARRHYPGETDLDPFERDGERGHGTQVAGIIAARSGQGGIVGVAPAAGILDVPVNLGGARENPDSPWVGLAWAVNHGADVANLSFGGPMSDYPSGSDELEIAMGTVEFAVHNSVVVVTGSGNCGNHGPWAKCAEESAWQVPAVFGGVLAVGAVQDDFHLAGYSTRNESVDLVAPGGGDDDPDDDDNPKILTTAPDGGLVGFNGTSAAAPHVAAAAAVLRMANPEATGREVRAALIDSANLERIPDDQRSDPGVGHGFLEIDAALGRLRPASPPDDDLADRTQAAFVQDDTLFAFDDDRAHPVRPIDRGSPVTWLEWSADHSRLVGLAGPTLFSWAGPDTVPVEVSYQVPCEACGPSLAHLDDVAVPTAERPGDLVVSLDYDGTLTQYDASSLEELGTTTLSFPADAPGTKTLVGDVGGRLLVHESGGAHESERLWLVDPASGEPLESREVAGRVQGRVAVNAADDRIAFVAGYSPCSDDNPVYVLDGEDLTEIATPATPNDPVNPSGMAVDELFFDGDALYATMTYRSSGGLGPCEAGSAGIWRLDGDTWEQVRSAPLTNARPLEGRPGDEPTGWLVVELDGRASVQPWEGHDTSHGDLGHVDAELWSTPTHTEVDLGGEGGGGSDDDPGDGGSDGDEAGRGTSEPGRGGTAPRTVEAAVARFEEFVHALGAGDVATACAIGRPAVEAGGGGLSCEEAVPLLREMAPEDELAALTEVTVDPAQVTQAGPNRVEIPPAYPYSTEPETDPPIVMEHDGTNWFVVE